MTTNQFLVQLRTAPGTIDFDTVIAVIDASHNFTPTAFRNGNQHNAAGENNGSCKIFAFAQLHYLTEEQTLACFGTYYREEVLGNPDGDSHANIRNFMRHGWMGVRFEGEALTLK